MIGRNTQFGFTMIELMVGITIACIMTVAIVNVYVNQNATLSRQNSRNVAAADAWEAYGLIKRLLEHADIASFSATYGKGARNSTNPPAIELLDNANKPADDEIEVNFRTPWQMNIWPNDQFPFQMNQMKLTWKNYGEDNYVIKLVISDGASTQEILLAGGAQNGNSKVINLDIWPVGNDGAPQANPTDRPYGGFLVVLNTRAGQKTGESDPTFSVSGRVIPRN